MCENFERFCNNMPIDVIKSQVYNAKRALLYYSYHVERGWKINVVRESFLISETHDAYCFILKSVFKMCLGRGKSEVYAIFSDEITRT